MSKQTVIDHIHTAMAEEDRIIREAQQRKGVLQAMLNKVQDETKQEQVDGL